MRRYALVGLLFVIGCAGQERVTTRVVVVSRNRNAHLLATYQDGIKRHYLPAKRENKFTKAHDIAYSIKIACGFGIKYEYKADDMTIESSVAQRTEDEMYDQMRGLEQCMRRLERGR